jgi:hypothetical protein
LTALHIAKAELHWKSPCALFPHRVTTARAASLLTSDSLKIKAVVIKIYEKLWKSFDGGKTERTLK